MPPMTGRPTSTVLSATPDAPSAAAHSSVATGGAAVKAPATKGPTKAQRAWLRRGLEQPGGKLPLFDENGRRVSSRMVKACLDAGWAEPWFSNPLKPDWQVCKLTALGREVVGEDG